MTTVLPSANGPEAISVDEALASCLASAQKEGISLQAAMERLGPASFCFVCFLLSVPSIQPISLGPFTMASGLTFMVAGWQMLRGRETPLLPKKARESNLQGKGWVRVLKVCQAILKFCRKFTRPRLESWVAGTAGAKLVGLLILIGGFLLALPAANLPFNNTFPALMIVCAAVSWLERDGLMVFVSIFWGALSILYFATVLILIYLFGSHVGDWLHHFWK